MGLKVGGGGEGGTTIPLPPIQKVCVCVWGGGGGTCSTTGVTKAVMCHPVCGMMHIKEPLLLIDNSSLCGGSGFSFSLSEWSLTICPTPYNRKIKC